MTSRRPPRWARVLAGLLVWGPRSEFVLGDLEEMYERAGRTGPGATVVYLAWVLGSALHGLRVGMAGGVRMDVVVALRQFRRRPKVYGGSAVVLAIGLGVATLTWGVRYGSVGRDLPVTDPDRVFGLLLQDERTFARTAVSVEDAELLRESLRGVEAFGLWTSVALNVSDQAGPPEEAEGYRVSADLLSILEIRTPAWSDTSSVR